MPQRIPQTHAVALVIGIAHATAVVAVAQQGPVAAMFADDQQPDKSLASSFATVGLPAAAAGVNQLRVLLSAGGLERDFDDLQTATASPATQRVLVARVQQDAAAMRALESQIATRRTQPPAANRGEPGLLRIGVDHVVARL